MATSSLASSPGAWKALFPEGDLFLEEDESILENGDNDNDERSWVITKLFANAFTEQQSSLLASNKEKSDVAVHLFPVIVDFPEIVKNYDYPGRVILRTKSTSTCFADHNDQETTITSMHSLHHSIRVVDKDPKKPRVTEFDLELDVDGQFPVCKQMFTLNPAATKSVYIDFSSPQEGYKSLIPTVAAHVRLAIDSEREKAFRVSKKSTSSLGESNSLKSKTLRSRWQSFTSRSAAKISEDES